MAVQAHRVLIVEDEFIVARNIQNSLEGMGYEAIGIAGTCEEACRLAESLNPDLVLMDIRLRGPGDGIEAAAAIHAKHELPVVYLTAHSDAETLKRAKTPAAYGFLIKPFDDRSLNSALEFALMRHQLGRELKESESRSQKLAAELSAVLDTTAVGLALLDAELRVTRVNARLKELFEIHSEGLGESWLELVPTMKSLESQLRDALRGEGLNIEEFGEEGSERRVFKLSTRSLSTEVRGSPEVLLEVIDMTDHVAAEAERKRLEEALAQAQKLESMGLMAGGVAHDFNNLLSVILAYSDLAIRSCAEDSKTLDYLQEIKRGGKRAAELCAQLMSFAGHGKRALSLVQLNSLIEEQRPLLEMSAKGRGRLELKLELAEDLPKIQADATQLRQVLLNLVVNGAEASLEGQESLRIRTGQSSLSQEELRGCFAFNGLPAGDYVWVEVGDKGQGIAEDALAKIFDPFFSTKAKGRGLGLAVVVGVARSHKGALSVKSSPEGSEFRLYLPINK